jgi:heavy metal sensor kinase
VRLPIRARLVVLHVSLLAVILAALFTFLVLRLRSDLVAGIDESLSSRAAQIALGLRGSGEGEFQDVSGAALRGLPRGESAAQLLSSGGAVLESSGDESARRPLLGPRDLHRVLSGARVRGTVSPPPEGEQLRVLAVGDHRPGTTRVVVVATSLEEVDRSVARLELLLLVAGPAALLAAGLGGWLLARRALLPVSRMTQEAAEIGVHRLDERIEVPGTADEVARLATTLNDMLDRLQRGAEERRRFVADASHELRTPLAVMATELDVSLRSAELSADAKEVLASAREEVGRMSRVVEDLLTLARIDEGRLELARRPVSLPAVAGDVVGKLSTFAAERGIVVRVEGGAAVVRGDPERLEQVLTNLVENAVKYSPDGTTVLVRTWGNGSEAGLSVSDAGPGIPAAAVPRVFDRFYRVDAARSRAEGGSGLGLAICREIVEAHGGRIWVESAPGKGSTFSLLLPVPSG